MGQSYVKPKLTLRLVVDEERNKVLLAEVCRDFVDVLFSFLTLPMGTIVRLLEEYRKSESVTVGCFTNLYKSVMDMSSDDFQTEACKEMLLLPRSMSDVRCKRLKLNINPSEGDRYFQCPTKPMCNTCSNFRTSRCKCGVLMDEKVPLPGANNIENDANGVFVRGKSSFIITDDLEVSVMSIDLVMEKLKSLGFGDFSKLGERLVDIGYEEVMSLLQCIFSSNAPLTDMFLNKEKNSQDVMKTCEKLGLYMERKRDESEENIITLNVLVRKHDMKIMYVECGEDFVDLLFTFLVIPLESVLEISSISSTCCISNLFKSFKDLSATQVSASNTMLPHYYRCQKQLLSVIILEPPKVQRSGEPVVLIDPKSEGCDQPSEGSWFVKRNTKFTVSDDLVITPMNSSSVFCLLKKLQIQAEELEVQEISITKTEATNLLRASLMTSCALNTALWNLIMNKPKKEN